MSFCKLPSVQWIITSTANTKLTKNYAQRSANNWSCYTNRGYVVPPIARGVHAPLDDVPPVGAGVSHAERHRARALHSVRLHKVDQVALNSKYWRAYLECYLVVPALPGRAPLPHHHVVFLPVALPGAAHADRHQPSHPRTALHTTQHSPAGHN